MTSFSWGSASHVGRVRQINQDSLLAVDGLFVVADGMGGHNGGEIASQVAIQTLRSVATSPSVEALVDAVHEANAAIIERTIDAPELSGMGTTICAIHRLDDDHLVIANVGDSRVYLFGGDDVHQLTDDHSLVGEMVRLGQLTVAQAAVHPKRNIVTRALGVDAHVQVDWWEFPVRPGDRFVLCSDGLFNEVSDAAIASTLRHLSDPNEAADDLVRQANANGGHDNVTVVVVDVDGEGDDDAATIPLGEVHISSRLAEVVQADPNMPSPTAGFTTAEDPPFEEPPREGRGIWGLVGPAVAVLALVGIAVVAISFYARSNFYVGVDEDRVAVFQGRPDGVLWFDPTLKETTGLSVADLTPALLDEVMANPDYNSLQGARGHVDRIIERLTELTGYQLTDDAAEAN